MRETLAPAWVGLFIPAEHPRAEQGSPKVCCILVLSQVEPEQDHCPHPTCSSPAGAEARVLPPGSEWEFSRWEQRDRQVSLLPQEAFPCPRAGRLQIFQPAVKSYFKKIWDFPMTLG